jgi:aryl-alcohol dehydrogenase-like predicted oxidoreductase
VQTEYSLFERAPEKNGLFDTLKELGIGFVSYSPLGRGFLTGDLKSPDDFPADDFRRTIPRFQGDNFYKNLELVAEIQQLAAEKGITPSQLAIAWTLAKGTVPIPGTKRVKYLEDNVAAASVTFTDTELAHLESILPLGSIAGERYDESAMAGVNL